MHTKSRKSFTDVTVCKYAKIVAHILSVSHTHTHTHTHTGRYTHTHTHTHRERERQTETHTHTRVIKATWQYTKGTLVWTLSKQHDAIHKCVSVCVCVCVGV